MRIPRPVVLAFLVFPPTAYAGSDGYERVYRFAVDWGPAPLAELSVRREEKGGVIRVEGEGRSVGLVSVFADFLVRQDAAYGPDGAARVSTESRWGDRRAARTVSYAPGAKPEVETHLDTGPNRERTPIPEGELVGAVDPLRPMIDALRSLDAGGGCGGGWRVFSGSTRFDVTMTPAGRDQLAADRDWTYSGDAVSCDMRFHRVGGFPVEDSGWSQDEADVTRRIWFARLDDGRYGPVRMQVSWPLGYATARIDLRDARP